MNVAAGTLDAGIQLPGEWLTTLLDLIARSLPGWRDDPARPQKTSETGLTSQLCAYLNGLIHHAPGWDFLQFRREEPDELDARRSIDLIAAPSGTVIVLNGRTYTQYQPLLPIECKRLPTPRGTDRDEREYVYSQYSSTGGLQRFKAGHHGGSHTRGAMIAYVQAGEFHTWKDEINSWIVDLCSSGTADWEVDDQLEIASHDSLGRVCELRSEHNRSAGGPISLNHIWIDM